MFLHNLPVIVPPQETDTNHTHIPSICHRWAIFLLMSHLIKWRHVIESYLPFPRSKVFLIINRMRRDFEVTSGGENLGEIGTCGGFVEVEDTKSCPV